MSKLVWLLSALMMFPMFAKEEHLKMIPEDMNIVLGLNVKKLVAIPLIKQQLAGDEEHKKELAKIGLKLEDIESVTMGVKAASEAAFANMNGTPEMIVVVGLSKSPDMVKIAEAAKSEGAKVSSETLGREITIIEENGEKIGMIAEGNHLVAGPLANLRSAVRVLNGSKKSLAENAMMKKLLNSDNTLYAGGTMKESPAVKGFSMICNYTDALKLFTKVYCKKAETAAEYAQQANALIGPIKQQMQLTDQHLKVEAKGY